MTEEIEKFLGIGEYHVTVRPTRVRTILGSCISVTMHHPATGYGAICHASLPATPAGHGVDYRYTDQVIRAMAGWFTKHGISRDELVVKLFGGGEMYGRSREREGVFTVGRRNIIAARKALREEGLSLAASDLGGDHGRSLTFHTATGRVWVRKTPRRAQTRPDPRA